MIIWVKLIFEVFSSWGFVGVFLFVLFVYWSIEARMINKCKYFSFPLGGVALIFKLEVRLLFRVKTIHNADKGEE